MARAAALAKRSAVNRKAAGQKSGGVKLGYTSPEFVGPPPGTFDPGLEAQVRQSERGLLDLIEQEHLAGKRGRQDTRQAQNLLRRKISQGRADLSRSRGYAIQDAGEAGRDLGTSFARDLADLAQAKQRGEEDYNLALTSMQHKYATAAQRQSEAAIQQGTSEAGTTTASGAVRGANQAYDKQGVDLAHTRSLEDFARSEARLREGFGEGQADIARGLDRELTGNAIQGRRLGTEGRTQFKALHLAALRAYQDRLTKISHGKREQALYATDVAAQAYYQAHEKNPHILFPTPAAVGGAAVPPAPQPVHRPRPAIGSGGVAYSTPHTTHPVPVVGLGPARSRPRRPYTRYGR